MFLHSFLWPATLFAQRCVLTRPQNIKVSDSNTVTTGIDQGLLVNFTVAFIQPNLTKFYPDALDCFWYQNSINASTQFNDDGVHHPVQTYRLGYDTQATVEGNQTFTGLYVSRVLDVGEHMDISRDPTGSGSDPCGEFVQQFVQGDGLNGCLWIEGGEGSCVHFWREAIDL